jgi:hypothetical protein
MLNIRMPNIIHQNWRIHSGIGRMGLEKNEYARLTLFTL